MPPIHSAPVNTTGVPIRESSHPLLQAGGTRAGTGRAHPGRRWRAPLAAVALSIFLSVPVQGQGLPADSLFHRLIGTWVLRGTIARQQTTHDVTFEWLLGSGYVRMHEVSREREPDGKPSYEAVVLFGRDPRSGEYAALWLDNTGSSAFDPAGTGRGYVAGDSISFLFRYDPVNSFHTTFLYDRRRDAWQWHMDNDSAGVRRPFARVALTRAGTGSP